MSESDELRISSLEERAHNLPYEDRAQEILIDTLCEIARQLSRLGDIYESATDGPELPPDLAALVDPELGITADVLEPPDPTIPALDTANKVLRRIATVCIAALDPEISREGVIVRVKDIYAQAVSLRLEEEDENEIYER